MCPVLMESVEFECELCRKHVQNVCSMQHVSNHFFLMKIRDKTVRQPITDRTNMTGHRYTHACDLSYRIANI